MEQIKAIEIGEEQQKAENTNAHLAVTGGQPVHGDTGRGVMPALRDSDKLMLLADAYARASQLYESACVRKDSVAEERKTLRARDAARNRMWDGIRAALGEPQS